jgi:hypothetical protein
MVKRDLLTLVFLAGAFLGTVSEHDHSLHVEPAFI